MASNILAVSATQYQLAADDRENLLASIPPKIHLPNQIVPDFVLQQFSEFCPELKNFTEITHSEMDRIIVVYVQQERQKFIEIYGNDGVFNAALNNECTM